MEPVSSRFLRYVKFSTQSDENSETCPSTPGQRILGAALVEEMIAMGIADAHMDEHGYVYGTVPGDPTMPTIGLIAHMDTSPDCSGANIRTKIVEYNGGDICLNAQKGIFMKAADYPGLKKHLGKHLIVTDGTTLLGADDKAGIAEIMTAAEYLRFCGRITGMKKDEIESRSQELLELVGLSKERHRIKGFSRGMKQRLGIAQALLNRPKLLICDEPTSALDPVGRKEILDILLAAREQTTVLFSTHILSDVERICTDIAFLNNGKAVIQGKLADVKSKYRSEEYLVETENENGAAALHSRFTAMGRNGNQLTFSEQTYTPFEVMAAVARQRIPIIKIERLEPSLEALFMEVVEK